MVTRVVDQWSVCVVDTTPCGSLSSVTLIMSYNWRQRVTSSSVCVDLIQEYYFFHSLSDNWDVFRDVEGGTTTTTAAARLLAAAVEGHDNIREIE